MKWLRRTKPHLWHCANGK